MILNYYIIEMSYSYSGLFIKKGNLFLILMPIVTRILIFICAGNQRVDSPQRPIFLNGAVTARHIVLTQRGWSFCPFEIGSSIFVPLA